LGDTALKIFFIVFYGILRYKKGYLNCYSFIKMVFMTRIPHHLGPIHFIGIGGIGMSAIAEVLVSLGYTVQGSDLSESANVHRLRGLGITVHIGQNAQNLGNAGIVVYSTAVKADNPERLEARRRRLPLVRRAEMLAEVMRFKKTIAVGGTHGKTTTTSLMAAVLEGGGIDPTVVNGGIINAYGSNARLGKGDWMVVEADESDGTFLRLPATLAVVTNMDPEHLDHYGSVEAMNAAYRQFVENVPFYGLAILCIDHPQVQAMLATIEDRRVITYGFSPQAQVRGLNLRHQPSGTLFDVNIDVAITGESDQPPLVLRDLFLPMPGQHNIQNALSVLAAAYEIGIDLEKAILALKNFSGVKRRFTEVGRYQDIPIIDDYGHHPVEIAAVLKAARQTQAKRVIAVVQPHRFSRVKALFNDFCMALNDADIVYISDIYAAGEFPLEGISKESLVEGIRQCGHRDVRSLPSSEVLAETLFDICQKGDIIVCLGAGTITQWAHALPLQLAEIASSRRDGSIGIDEVA
jgi:UDP-N-acetylmuramate--alanine ligase